MILKRKGDCDVEELLLCVRSFTECDPRSCNKSEMELKTIDWLQRVT